MARIASDVEFVIDHFDFALEPGKALESYMQSSRLLTVMLVLNLLYEAGLIFFLVANYDYVLVQIVELYRMVTISRIDTILRVTYTIDIVLCSLSYGAGFYAVWSHRTSAYEWFVRLVLLTAVSKIVMSYLNVLNVMVFIMKVALFLMGRFVLSLLHTVLLVPQRH